MTMLSVPASPNVHIRKFERDIIADLFNGIPGSHKAVTIGNSVRESTQSCISFFLSGEMKLFQENFIF